MADRLLAKSRIGCPQKITHYALLYSVSTFGSQTSAIGLAFSTSMDAGSWTDLGAIITSAPGKTPYNAIDGNLFKLNSASSNTYLLSLGSFWSGIYQTQISLPSTPGLINKSAVGGGRSTNHDFVFPPVGRAGPVV